MALNLSSTVLEKRLEAFEKADVQQRLHMLLIFLFDSFTLERNSNSLEDVSETFKVPIPFLEYLVNSVDTEAAVLSPPIGITEVPRLSRFDNNEPILDGMVPLYFSGRQAQLENLCTQMNSNLSSMRKLTLEVGLQARSSHLPLENVIHNLDHIQSSAIRISSFIVVPLSTMEIQEYKVLQEAESAMDHEISLGIIPQYHNSLSVVKGKYLQAAHTDDVSVICAVYHPGAYSQLIQKNSTDIIIDFPSFPDNKSKHEIIDIVRMLMGEVASVLLSNYGDFSSHGYFCPIASHASRMTSYSSPGSVLSIPASVGSMGSLSSPSMLAYPGPQMSGSSNPWNYMDTASHLSYQSQGSIGSAISNKSGGIWHVVAPHHLNDLHDPHHLTYYRHSAVTRKQTCPATCDMLIAPIDKLQVLVHGANKIIRKRREQYYSKVFPECVKMVNEEAEKRAKNASQLASQTGFGRNGYLHPRQRDDLICKRFEREVLQLVQERSIHQLVVIPLDTPPEFFQPSSELINDLKTNGQRELTGVKDQNLIRRGLKGAETAKVPAQVSKAYTNLIDYLRAANVSTSNLGYVCTVETFSLADSLTGQNILCRLNLPVIFDSPTQTAIEAANNALKNCWIDITPDLRLEAQIDARDHANLSNFPLLVVDSQTGCTVYFTLISFKNRTPFYEERDGKMYVVVRQSK